MRFSLLPLAPIIALASCVAPPRQAPAPQPAPPAPAPTPAPAPPPPSADWRDRALTPGAWRYAREGAGSSATYALGSAPPSVTIRCDPTTRRMTFALPGARSARQLTVRTSFGAVNWPLQAAPSDGIYIAIRMASDPTLDQIAFSRGRFMLEAPGATPLALPTWAEIARVVEDCRG